MEKPLTSDAHMDELCDICGDIGFSDALAACPQCRISREHLYCMRVCCLIMPEVWHCEECEKINERVSLSSDAREFLLKTSSVNTYSKLHCDPVQPNKLHNGSSQNSRDPWKKIQTGKVKPLSPQEVIKLSSGAKKPTYPVKFTLRPSTMLCKSRTSLLERTPDKSRTIPQKSFSQLARANSSSGFSKHLNPQRPRNSQTIAITRQQVTQSFKKLREKDVVQAPLEKRIQEKSIHKEQPVDCLQHIANAKMAEMRVDMKIAKAFHVSSQSTCGQPIVNSEKDAVQAPLEEDTEEKPIHKEQSMESLYDAANAKMADMKADMATANASNVFSPSSSGQQIVNSEKDAAQPHLEEHTPEKSLTREQSVESPNDVTNAKVGEMKADLATPNVSSPSTSGQQNVNSELQTVDPKSASPTTILPKLENCFYGPALDASWKGSFKISDSSKLAKINDEIKAHTPSRVLRKVYKFSKQMPEVLNFELVQRGKLWMNLFDDCCPDEKDIGLYFFLSKNSRDENYISLLDLIGAKNLVMRKYMDGVELLVFTSKLLLKDCQRWEGMFYLWGLFHRVKKAGAATKVGPPENRTEEDNRYVVDMEIDTVGGKDVGRTDVVVPRELPRLPKEAFYNIPPGFEKVGKLGLGTSDPSLKNSGLSAVKVELF